MKGWISLEQWRGKRDVSELDPAKIEFMPRPAPKSCSGCIFNGQYALICDKAVEIAVRAGMGHCEHDGVIYIAKPVDPRQIRIDEADP